MDDFQVTRIAVYDLYWSTFGGGEQFAGGIASVLSERYDVDLVGPLPIDRDALLSRLGLDLSRCGVRQGRDDREVTGLSADYDLLINTTFLSSAACHAAHGLYVVHFPGALTDPAVERKDRLRQRVGALRRGARLVAREGVHVARSGVVGRLTDGAAKLEVFAPSGAMMRLAVAAPQWGSRQPRVRVAAGHTTVFDDVIGSNETTVTFELPPTIAGAPAVVWVVSDTDAPEAFGLPWHLARVGVELRSVQINGDAVSLDAGRVAVRLSPPDRLGYLDTYDAIASNAQFTAGWVERLWHRPSEVLYPAVRMLEALPKTKTIVNVGRFFGAAAGHSKKQLEMIEGFRRLHESGGADGWTLHLIGGCSAADRDYGMAVKRAAQGLPIEVHFNAPGPLVRELVGSAAIYWHASGLGEDLEHHPDRYEHFGISVVEAMSACCAPVVIGAAGPAEVVRNGVDGRHFLDIDGLVTATAELIADPVARERFQRAAGERARDFSYDAFRPRLLSMVERLMAG
jgi:glycosyltransferase involved in cell wall biosynthesis